MQRIHLLAHGKSRKSAHALALFKAAFEAAQHPITIHLTEHSKHATALASALVPSCDVLLVLGGDGTLHETAAGLINTQRTAEELPIVALWPCGSGNDFSRNFPKPTTIDAFVQRILKGSFHYIDAARVTGDHKGEDVMINAADAGLGPLVVQKVTEKPTHWSGSLKFGISILQAFLSYRPIVLSVQCDAHHYSGKVLTIVVANGRYFGSGIGIAPAAEVDDGWLEVTIVGNVSMVEYLRYLPALKRGQRIQHPQIHYWRGKHIQIEGSGQMECDGELSVGLKASVQILPKALRWLS